MAHKQQRSYCLSTRWRFYGHFVDRSVLDVGSMDVNGNNRKLFVGGSYLGCDVSPGNNVDFVGNVREVEGRFDFIISTEMLEHSPTWREDLIAMGEMLPRRGCLLMTCAGPGRAEHGTAAHPIDGMVCEGDYYRNVSVSEVLGALHHLPWLYLEARAETKHRDTYLFGIRA